MPVAFPLSLRTIIKASKSRTQPSAFAMSQPRKGMPYVRAIGTVAPAHWDVQFRFTATESIRFQLWFVTSIDRGFTEFTMPIMTESGLVSHLCQFLPDGLGDCQQDGNSFTYSAKLIGDPV